MGWIKANRSPASLLAALFAAACGGSGSPPPPSPPPSPPLNTPPVFTSASAVSVQEGFSGTIYVVSVSDPDPNQLSVTLSGGPDAARFSYDGFNRNLAFLAPPDFEAPTDANGDNVYEVQFRATDGFAVVFFTVRITVTNVVNGGRVREVATGLGPTSMIKLVPDGSGRLAAVVHSFLIHLVDPSTGAIDTTNAFFSIPGQVREIFGVEFSPAFATDRTVYVLYRAIQDGPILLRRFQVFPTGPLRVDGSTGDTILEFRAPTAFNDRYLVVQMAFHSDGTLLLGTRDGTPFGGGLIPQPGGGDAERAAQNPLDYRGKILRIDVSGDDFPGDPLRDYRIPTGNAYPGGAGGLPEILAKGVGAPSLSPVDPVTGLAFFVDGATGLHPTAGTSTAQELNRLPATPAGEIDFGWSQRTGTQTYFGPNQAGFTAPVMETFTGQVVLRGVIYRGPIASIQGRYLNSALFSTPLSNLTGSTTITEPAFTDHRNEFDPNRILVDMAGIFPGANGNYYIPDSGGEALWVLEPFD